MHGDALLHSVCKLHDQRKVCMVLLIISPVPGVSGTCWHLLALLPTLPLYMIYIATMTLLW